MIDANSPAFIAAVYAILLVPLVFLGWGWASYFRCDRRAEKPAAAALTVATLSYVFLGLSFLFRSALLGSDYGSRLYRTSEFNLVLSLGSLFFTFRTDGPKAVNIPAFVACALVALAWCYVLVVNSVV